MDAEGSKLAEGKKFTYTGSLLAGINGISAPPDGVLVLDKEGKDTFTLGHGQAIVIKGIPLGSKIRIVQETGSDFASFIEDNSEGYLISNNTGDKSLNKEGRKFNFINMHAAPVPTGLDENVRTSAALLFLPASLAAIIVPCFFVIERTRRDCGFRDRC